MKILLPLLSLLVINACAAKHSLTHNDTCDIAFDKLTPCTYQSGNSTIEITIMSTNVADDEKSIDQLIANTNQKTQTLLVTENTSLLTGDIGYISFADINFDDVPDLAITTSFGTPNLYLDYWVFNTDIKQYVFVGNFPELKLDKKNKTITTEVKSNAENYKIEKWHWHRGELKQQ